MKEDQPYLEGRRRATEMSGHSEDIFRPGKYARAYMFTRFTLF